MARSAIAVLGREELEEIGFIICSQCGARMRADRLRCLRCQERLVAYRPPELRLPAWLEAIGGGTFIFAAVFSLALVVIIMTILG